MKYWKIVGLIILILFLSPVLLMWGLIYATSFAATQGHLRAKHLYYTKLLPTSSPQVPSKGF